MKKSFNKITALFMTIMSLAVLFLGCKTEPDFTQEGVTIDGSTLGANPMGFIEYPLDDYDGKEIKITFSAKMQVTNNSGKDAFLMWQINTSSYPIIASHTFGPGKSNWVEVKGSMDSSVLVENNVIYLSTYQLDPSKFIISLKNVKYSISASTPVQYENEKVWTDSTLPSLKDTYEDLFKYTGIAVTGSELTNAKIQAGLKKHCNTITMGNEFKPDFVMQWWGNPTVSSESFTASNGITIKTPVLKGLSSLDNYLEICRKNGMKMRGHVLVWHSQTQDAFFCKDYNTANALVGKAEMTARQEWYIKTVLEYVAAWEAKNNNGEHIIWAWDVVNEAIADGSSSLRTNSKWYDIYKSDEFIVNAFRFANKYAPSDVLLCYNDYNCTDGTKRTGMVKVLKNIISHETDETLPTRIDAMGMQSHISVNTSTSSFVSAVKDYLNLGLDVQVTELDIATETNYKPSTLAKWYYDFFKLFIKYRKTESSNGISTITIWGINDESTWLNSKDQMQWHGNVKQYPLLFRKNASGEIITKEAFDKVIEAAQ